MTVLPKLSQVAKRAYPAPERDLALGPTNGRRQVRPCSTRDQHGKLQNRREVISRVEFPIVLLFVHEPESADLQHGR